MKAKLFISRSAAAVIFQCGCLLAAQPATSPGRLVTFAPDGTSMAVVTDSGRIQLRKTSGGRVERTFLICDVQTLAFSQDGKMLAAGGGTNDSQAKIKVWRFGDLQPLCVIPTSGGGAKALALSMDGSLVVGAGSGGRVEAWRVSDGKMQWSSAVSPPAKSLCFSADGQKLLIQCADGVEREIDPMNGRSVTPQEPAKQ